MDDKQRQQLIESQRLLDEAAQHTGYRREGLLVAAQFHAREVYFAVFDEEWDAAFDAMTRASGELRKHRGQQ